MPSSVAPQLDESPIIRVRVEKVRCEARETATISFRPLQRMPSYRAGQFLTIDPHQFEALGPRLERLEVRRRKRELPRSYSLASAPQEGLLTITVRREAAEAAHDLPLLSPFLVDALKVGETLQVEGFFGQYVLPESSGNEMDELVVHLVAGAGAAPNFSILKDDLQHEGGRKHLFLSSNRTWLDACYIVELDALERRHPTRLRVVHTFTREVRYGAARHGRITADLIQKLVPALDAAVFYVCGPAITTWERRRAMETGHTAQPRFLESMIELLRSLGIPSNRIKREAWL